MTDSITAITKQCNELIDNATIDYQRGDYQLAIDKFTRVIQFKAQAIPKYLKELAYLNRGACYLNLNQLDEAKTDQLTVIANYNHININALNNLGMIHERQQEYKTAYKYFDEAMALDPNNCLPYINKAIGKLSQKKVQAAINLLLQAQKLQPNYSRIYYNLGIAYAQQNQLETAINYFSTGLQQEPTHQEALYARIQCYQAYQVQYPEKQKQIEEQIKTDYLQLARINGLLILMNEEDKENILDRFPQLMAKYFNLDKSEK